MTPDKKTIVIKGVPKKDYTNFRIAALKKNQTMGVAMTEAMKLYVEKGKER